MSVFAHETFEGFAVGTLLSSMVAYQRIGFGDGIVVSGGWNSNNALNLDADVGIGQTIPPIKTITLGVYLYAGLSFNFTGAHIFECRSFASGIPDKIIAFATIEANGSISVYSADNLIMCNTGIPGNGIGPTLVPFDLPPFYVTENNWTYVIFSFGFGSWLDAGTPKLTCGCNVSINSVEYNTGSEFTQVLVGSLPLPVPLVNKWNCGGFGGIGNKMDNLYVSDLGGYGEPFFPLDKIVTRVSQVAVEHQDANFPNRKIHASQLVVEHQAGPFPRSIRASQLVVEVMGKGTAIASDGMKVREI